MLQLKEAEVYLRNNYLKVNYFFRLAFFWWLYFTFFRIAFIIFHFDKIPKEGKSEIFGVFIKGFRLDLSIICYFLFIPFLLKSIALFHNSPFWNILNKNFNYFLIIIVTLISLGNIKIYQEWQTLLNFRALNYLSHPGEIIHFLSIGTIIILIISLGIFIFVGLWLFKKKVRGFDEFHPGKWNELLQFTGIAVLLIVFSRGGLQQIPVNESSAYYSNSLINNHIAINPEWYLVHSLLESNAEKNPYAFMDKAKAESLTQKLFEEKSDSSIILIKPGAKPNIVFIVLESWTADLLKIFGNKENITPNANELVKESLVFTNAYASGSRTEQGLISIFSGFPAQPNNSIITDPAKAEHLPSIIKILKGNHYKTSFYYGGESEFANMKTYLLSSGMELIIDKNDFKKSEMNSKWGAHDGYVLDKNLEGLKNSPQPFLSIVLTLSTHEPFEVPIETPFVKNEEPEKFKKAAFYTDHCLGEYFKKAKKEAWFENTLFILVADHGHRLPLERDLNTSAAKHITLIMLGGALKNEWKGKSFAKIVSQHDLPSTLLHQMGLDSKEFQRSRDMFASKTPFAYFSNENVLGWVTPDLKYSYYFTSRELKEDSGKQVPDSIVIQSQAYLQTLYQQYLAY